MKNYETDLAHSPAAKGVAIPFRLLRSVVDRRDRNRLVLVIIVVVAVASGNATAPLLLREAVDDSIGGGTGVVSFLIAYSILFLLVRVVTEWRFGLYGPLEQSMQRKLYVKAYDLLLNGEIKKHIDAKAGTTTQTLVQGVGGVRAIMFSVLLIILPLLVEVIIILAVVVLVLDVVYATVLAVILVLYALLFWSTVGHLRTYFRAGLDAFLGVGGSTTDSLNNLESIRLYRAEKRARERIDQLFSIATEAWISWYHRRACFGMVLALVLNTTFCFLIFLSAVDFTQGTITLGSLVMLSTYILQLSRPVELLGVAYRDVRQGVETAEALGELLERMQPTPCRARRRSNGFALETRKLGFTGNCGQAVLYDIDVEVPWNSRIGIIGPTGSGKSTLLRLLAGVLTPTSGRIAVGAPAHEITGGRSARIALVPQHPVLLNDSLFENLRLAAPELNRRAAEHMLEELRLSPLLSRTGMGLDTSVGEHGVRLSGGERQRIAIARALLAEPEVLLLDEATSALDATTEQAVLNLIERTLPEAAKVVAAHRLELVADADLIVVIHGGSIVEQGRHAKLLASSGYYAAAWRQQTSSAKVAEAWPADMIRTA